MLKNVEIIIGTYEEFLLGYKLEFKNNEEVLKQSFADKSHTNSIKCLGIHGKYIATGGADDRIFIYDMKTRKQSQILLNHEGTVNAIAFTSDDTHILSAGDDGRMVAARLNTWQVGANWKKAHNGSPVTHISCHPSGKLALSLGSDLVLRTWNLVKGRVAYKTNLKNRTSLGGSPDCLSWSPNGDYFSLTGQRVVEIWCIKKADVIKTEKTKSKPVSVCWASDDVLIVGLEDGSILFISINDKEDIVTLNAHKSRVKAISIMGDILVSASSSGEVKIWNLDTKNRKLKEIASTNIGCRPTCIGILDLDQFGADYFTQGIPVSKKEGIAEVKEKSLVAQQRGVVTIEYDDDDDNGNDKNESEQNEDAEISDEEQHEGPSKKVTKKRKTASEVQEISQQKRSKQNRNQNKNKKKTKENSAGSKNKPGAFVRARTD